MDIKHLLLQAKEGEFSLLREVASKTTVQEFSKQVDVPITKWGKNGIYDCVKVERCSYLWKDGKFDGWCIDFDAKENQ